jgi:superfamily II DNA helicase RecQ
MPAAGDVPGTGLVVVDRAHALTDDDAARVCAVRRAVGDPPLLAVTGAADDVQRARLTDRLCLRDPVHAGGGWDPAGTWLGAVEATTAAARRRTVTDLVRRGRPALVVVPTRGRADRTVTGLAADGLRALVWAPAPMRSSRATTAVGAWRSRRLDALVVPEGPLPPLGRVQPGCVVGDGVADWYALVDAVAPATAVLVVGGRDASTGCRRAALLARYGEPVTVPCGRCDRCAPSSGGLSASA